MKKQTASVIEVRDVHKVYGSQQTTSYEALKGINFQVMAGEFVGVMGASGSGKTTLLNLLAILDRPTSGVIKINDQDLSQIADRQLSEFRGQQLGFIFQDFSLLENLTAAENIALPLDLQGVNKQQSRTQVEKISRRLSIEKFIDQYPAQLSGGQKQRVAAARALVNEPRLILADEPTGALDSDNARDLMELLTQINQEDHVSVLMVTHDPFSASYCERILMIKDGQIGQTIERDGQPRHDFYQSILSDLGTYR